MGVSALDIYKIRNKNAVAIFNATYLGMTKEFAEATGIDQSYCSKILGLGKQEQRISDKMARKIESGAGFAEGSIDSKAFIKENYPNYTAPSPAKRKYTKRSTPEPTTPRPAAGTVAVSLQEVLALKKAVDSMIDRIVGA